MHNHSGASLFRHFLVLVPRGHLLFAEVAGLEVDVLADRG